MAGLKTNRVPVMMTDAELKAIDDWAFARRCRSRGGAIRVLCAIGLGYSDWVNRDDVPPPSWDELGPIPTSPEMEDRLANIKHKDR